MEEREKHRPKNDEDVEAHKKHTPVALRGDEAPTPEGEGADGEEPVLEALAVRPTRYR